MTNLSNPTDTDLPSGRGFTHESATAETVEWYTPPWLLDRIGLRYDLDPCSPGHGESAVPAERVYTLPDDGLTLPWSGTVYCNPPYGKETVRWMRKLADHGDGIALVFARTDTAWFQEAAARASAICFIAGRVKFINGRTRRPAGSPGAGSALIAYGHRAAAALRQSGLGFCVLNTDGRTPGDAADALAELQHRA